MLNPSTPSFAKPDLNALCNHVKEISIECDAVEEIEAFKINGPVSEPTLPSSPEPASLMIFSNGGTDDDDDDLNSDEECKTPRGEEYRIPEITTCPPAPKRPRNMGTTLLTGFNVKGKLDSSGMENVLKKRDGGFAVADESGAECTGSSD